MAYDKNGEEIYYDHEVNTWKYLSDTDGEYISISRKKKRVCGKCGKPQLDLNGVENCDFCLQGLTVSDFISDACCGHGNDTEAYIFFKDGRRWILDKEWSRKE